jgi:2-amino-4-hydroxy-6-hydroxymethyldihydropteridine diphosphokinase
MNKEEGMHQVYLGLGSNLGDRKANIERAITLIDEQVGQVVRRSSLIETEPWGFASENRFLNAVVCCETDKAPREVLLTTQQIERTMGRKRKSVAVDPKPSAKSQVPKAVYSDRPIDIDILLYDDLTVDEPGLKIPHPLMHERDFVMIPLKEIYNN